MTKTGLWEDNLPEITQPLRLAECSSKAVLLTRVLEAPHASSPSCAFPGLRLPHSTYPSSSIFLLLPALTLALTFSLFPTLRVTFSLAWKLLRLDTWKPLSSTFPKDMGVCHGSLSQDMVPFLRLMGTVKAKR